QTKIDVLDGDKKTTVSLLDFLEKKDKYKPIVKEKSKDGGGGYTGLILVPNVVEQTPSYVEEVVLGSLVAKAGLRPDDLIVYVDGDQVVSIKAYKEILDKVRPGSTI